MGRRTFWVYIMANGAHTVLYTSVTSNLGRRVWQNRNGAGSSFTSKYNVTKLVYFETVDDALEAIRREKQIKAGSRERKLALVESQNPTWRDLFEEIV
jgi:putative endonuclease